jgi:hypothetical protein
VVTNVVKFMRPTAEQQQAYIQALWSEQEELGLVEQYTRRRKREIDRELAELFGMKEVR